MRKDIRSPLYNYANAQQHYLNTFVDMEYEHGIHFGNCSLEILPVLHTHCFEVKASFEENFGCCETWSSEKRVSR